MPVCSGCKKKLRKEDVVRIDEWDFRTENPFIVKKSVMCTICGKILLEKEVSK